MIKSMTGFGKSQVEQQGYSATCEVRGVNHRYFDPHIRISRRYMFLEDRIKDEIKQFVTRGRIEMTINIEKTGESARNIKVDNDLAMAYYKYLKELAEKLNISPDLRVIDIFRLPEVFDVSDDEEDLELVWSVLKEAVRQAMDSMADMRSKEGLILAQDILERNDLILTMVNQLEEFAPQVASDYKDKLRKRITELVGQDLADEQRIIQEAAIFADKASITEEIVRLKSHIKHFTGFINDGEAIGRKCDFLIQEMFREINTVASKNNHLEMSRIVVDVKAELEKIREQIQNIE
ncbi:MAG TPA: YicC family protein [Syntrophomonadaceae bacterium]|nr:YicC family protein [Syntrophomonadaceae bacterium]HPR93755.1 YicC family protein [Syntrophomonadaceae bacterium]